MNKKYLTTVGLEIHAELATNTKMFCACKNDPDEDRPNTNICPVCMGHPGTLPLINKEAVRSVLKVGTAIGASLADLSEFDRKNYFYPDIPKGYQISQYKYPLVSGGYLDGVKITRVHLEEDTASSSHDTGDFSLVDFNRAGVPLMELVTEPVLHSSSQAVHFGKELQLLLQYLGVSEANMEKGQMRFEANISVAEDKGLDTDGRPLVFGTKVEVKNLNSFKAAERAIEYEIKRHIDVLEKGGSISQETRGWDEKGQKTVSQRSKENSNDYRYFPDPDLPKLKLSEMEGMSYDELKQNLKETPKDKRARFAFVYALKNEDIEFYVYNTNFSYVFESAASILKSDDKKQFQLLSNYIVSDLTGIGDKAMSIDPNHLAELVSMIYEGKLSSRAGKDILLKMVETKEAPFSIAERECLFQKNDEAFILDIVNKVFSTNQDAVSEYKSGKESALQFLVGQSMKLSRGVVNPGVLKEVLIRELSK